MGAARPLRVVDQPAHWQAVVEEIRETWPPIVDVPTGGAALGLGRDGSYQAAREGTLPGARQIGRRRLVVTAELLAFLEGR